MGRWIDIFDSTLRDGSQGEGMSFSLEDKLRIVQLLDELGVSYIEAGNPASNVKDRTFFQSLDRLSLRSARIVAFGSTRRPGTAADEDSSLLALAGVPVETVAIFGKSWDYQAREILRISPEENLELISSSVSFLRQSGKTVFFDAEHFFDGYRENPSYAMACLEAAHSAGAHTLVLCETRGGCLPDEVASVTAAVVEAFPGVPVAIHAHNDSGCAVASSLLAVRAGACQVQGTLLGIGERCGNADLSTIIADLTLKMGVSCIHGRLDSLSGICNAVAAVSNMSISASAPYIGASAFAHKGGMHIDGVLKDPRSFEHERPQDVGAVRRLLMSEVSGRALLMKRVERIRPGLDKDSPEVVRLMEILKSREAEGYQYEGAENSFDVIIYRELFRTEPFFTFVHYQTIGSLPYADGGDGNSHTALVKARVRGESAVAGAEGRGPVNALDKALRCVLEQFYPSLRSVHLTDYKVRVLDGSDATASRVRVLITSSDGADSWSTIGVSSDIIKASFLALSDSIEYKLFKDRYTKEVKRWA